ncbi:MAG: PIN domain containing protein VapC [Candidatus Methanohalarchaeum thermophilum]|uniref:PIN domain containing protein VapC n=1 Tax=Methanohalarchaeum thermophilum TaxID=1903181 RepID=A0A1Q6DST8_METT1|nr:MAG: PIN domain containing protein VapC [Candidatus Methanohalarchaeum thermophilum]
MKIVSDTNVIVSAIFWEGNESEIIELIEEGELKLITSPPILNELRKVLSYDKFGLDEEEINNLIEYILFLAETISPKQDLDIIKEDTSDNKFLECAKEGEADYIVSGDQHLLKIEEFKGTKIVNAKELLEILGKRS